MSEVRSEVGGGEVGVPEVSGKEGMRVSEEAVEDEFEPDLDDLEPDDDGPTKPKESAPKFSGCKECGVAKGLMHQKFCSKKGAMR